jgi:ferredoxin
LSLNPAFLPIFEALKARQYFKLICGGSFSEPNRLKQLIQIYTRANVSAIDVSAALPVTEAAIEALSIFPNPPMLMVSFPLDADPHFRKIELTEDACIRCGICIPVCPTQVFHLPEDKTLQLETPLCYGCGRCVPLCPTDALKLDPFTVYPDLIHVLSKPQVTSVEIHTTHADPAMIDPLYAEVGTYLEDKLISLCLRPQTLPLAQVITFITQLKSKTRFPLIIQIDGIPMSGSDDPEASRSALNAARDFALVMPADCYLTISGGINNHTAKYLKQSEYAAIQGVGMGTFARQKVWHSLATPNQVNQIAESLVGLFRLNTKSAIIKV